MRKGLYLIIILLFPSLIYLIFSLGEHNVSLPRFYGEYEVSEAGDTTYLSVAFPTLVDAQGRVINGSSISGKVVVVDVFTQPCDETCRTKMATLANYLHKMEMRDKWMVVSIAMNETDAAGLQVLSEQVYNVGDNWRVSKPENPHALTSFLEACFVKTERVASIEELPSREFFILDQKGRIRSYFDSRIYKENRKLEDAIKILLKEPHFVRAQEELSAAQ